jgi:hypothetical protein
LGGRLHDGDRTAEPQQTIFQNTNANSSQTATSFTDLSSKLSELEKRDVDSVSIEATLNNSRQHIRLSEKGPQTDESVVAEDETVAPTDGSARQTVDSSTDESEPSVDNRDDGPENGQEALPDPRSPASTLLPVPPIVTTNVITQEHESFVHYDALHYPVSNCFYYYSGPRRYSLPCLSLSFLYLYSINSMHGFCHLWYFKIKARNALY